MRNATAYRYRRFDAEFFVDCDPCAAYQRAGFKAKTPGAIRANASKLLASASLQPYLAEAFARIQALLDLQQDRAMLEICLLANSSMKDVMSWGPDGVVLKDSGTLPDDIARTVQDVHCVKKVRTSMRGDEPVTEETTRTRLKLYSKRQALGLLQGFFQRGDPLSAEVEQKIKALVMIMAHYVSQDRWAAFRAHVAASLGIEIPEDIAPRSAAIPYSGNRP